MKLNEKSKKCVFFFCESYSQRRDFVYVDYYSLKISIDYDIKVIFGEIIFEAV